MPCLSRPGPHGFYTGHSSVSFNAFTLLLGLYGFVCFSIEISPRLCVPALVFVAARSAQWVRFGPVILAVHEGEVGVIIWLMANVLLLRLLWGGR